MPESDGMRAYRLAQIRQQQAEAAQPQTQQRTPVVDWTERNEERQRQEFIAIQKQFKELYPDYTPHATTPTPTSVPVPQPMPPTPKPAAQAKSEQGNWNPGYQSEHDRVMALAAMREARTPKPWTPDESDPRLQADRAKQEARRQQQQQRSADLRQYSQMVGRPPALIKDHELDRWIAGGRRRSLF